MPSTVQQNRVAIQLAISALARNHFHHVVPSQDQGTFPHAHISATRGEASYLVGVTCREEIGADGKYNPSYNIVKTEADLASARALADERSQIPAFVTIALNRREGTYSAFFGTLQSVDYRRSIPMLPGDRRSYEPLIKGEYDSRVEDLE